ncbi:MAG: FAD-dependent oxidoreductase [Burkholderiales bacterium]
MPQLAFGLRFEDLYRQAGLAQTDAAFLGVLAGRDPALAERLRAARAQPGALSARDEAALLLSLAPHLDAFIAELFDITEELVGLRAAQQALAPLVRVKWKFVKRKALLTYADASALADFNPAQAHAEIESWLGAPFEELAFAQAVLEWQAQGLTARLDIAMRYSAWAVHSAEGQARHGDGVLFRHPVRVDPAALLTHARQAEHHGATIMLIDARRLHRRAGFDLTDAGTDLRGALDQANYCLWCHGQGNDSCSHGIREKAAGSDTPAFRRSALGVPLTGCPLQERISEFQQAKAQGHAVAALALITLDNPMAAATGHRICNDCMKACVYQQQTPVDIPQVETRVLRDVLALPWGFEIYSLLTRWNPLNLRRPLPLPDSGRKVLVVGMGPAGFTLAHHLMNEGHSVVGIDGLKIEPLPPALNGVAEDGSPRPFEPVLDVDSLREPLAQRVSGGFGGVAEYGITVRWDKNFLTLVRLLLERRSAFRLIGGVRFGGTLDTAGAFALGFDHIALATGAGRPTTLDIPNGMARGVRTASDFLMALQLTGAARADSLANLQLRLPVVVVGGGLTAIDTATESLAYYPVQVEKFLARHEALVSEQGEAAVRSGWTEEERELADEFIGHARAIRAERERAARAGEPARVLALLQAWGGVTIAYRRGLTDSPAYRLNHEELERALAEGIGLGADLAPVAVELDRHGAAAAIRLSQTGTGAQRRWPARTVFIAAGTQPNTVAAREDPAQLRLDGRHYQLIDAQGAPLPAPAAADGKPARAEVFTSRFPDGRLVSFFGDLHPAFAGNVVRAMASAKRGCPEVSRVLAARAPASQESFPVFAARVGDGLRAQVHRVTRLAPGIVEVVVRAPFAAQRFRPGQFFRLQNFETRAPRPAPGGLPTRLAMEGLALTGAWVDPQAGLVSTIVLEMGGSSDLCARLQPGEPVVLMGPTGEPTTIPAGEQVVLVGGGLGNAVLFSIGAAMRAAGCRVLYVAGYRHAADRFMAERIEAAADAVIWCCDEAPGFTPARAQDRSFAGNVVDALLAWSEGRFGELPVTASRADRLVAIGSDRMMAAVAAARHGLLAGRLRPDMTAIASVNAPMQCMLKEICAQCLQARRDPAGGPVRYVFACMAQDMPMDEVDFGFLDARLRQNSLAEKLTRRWLPGCLQAAGQPAAPG